MMFHRQVAILAANVVVKWLDKYHKYDIVNIVPPRYKGSLQFK